MSDTTITGSHAVFEEAIARADPATLVDLVLRASARLSAEHGRDEICRIAHDSTITGGGDPLPALLGIVQEKQDVVRVIAPENVLWNMDWSGLNEDGTRRHPEKPENEEVFEIEHALALLLVNEVAFLNQNHWEKSWPEEARRTFYVGINCNDVFAWGCSDAEGASYDDIETVYRHWLKDPHWGTAVWCMIKRRELPQRPVAERIAKAGIWNLDALAVEHGLKPNHYDGVSSVLAGHKYRVYCDWERSQGRDPRPFDKEWWAGWREFTAAVPGWYDDAWKAEDARLREEWRAAHGHA